MSTHEPLFLRTPSSKDLFSEKVASALSRMPDDEKKWPAHIYSEILRELPFLAQYDVEIVLDRADPEAGAALGYAQVRNKTMSRPQDNIATPGNIIRVPIIVQDRRLQKFYVFEAGKQVYPLNESRVEQAMLNPAVFDTDATRMPASSSIIDQLFPPSQSRNGFGRVVDSSALGLSKLSSVEGEKAAALRDYAKALRTHIPSEVENLHTAHARAWSAHGAAEKLHHFAEQGGSSSSHFKDLAAAADARDRQYRRQARDVGARIEDAAHKKQVATGALAGGAGLFAGAAGARAAHKDNEKAASVPSWFKGTDEERQRTAASLQEGAIGVSDLVGSKHDGLADEVNAKALKVHKKPLRDLDAGTRTAFLKENHPGLKEASVEKVALVFGASHPSNAYLGSPAVNQRDREAAVLDYARQKASEEPTARWKALLAGAGTGGALGAGLGAAMGAGRPGAIVGGAAGAALGGLTGHAVQHTDAEEIRKWKTTKEEGPHAERREAKARIKSAVESNAEEEREHRHRMEMMALSSMSRPHETHHHYHGAQSD